MTLQRTIAHMRGDNRSLVQDEPKDVVYHMREWVRIQAAAAPAMVAMFDAALDLERRREARTIRQLVFERDPLGRGYITRAELMDLLAERAAE